MSSSVTGVPRRRSLAGPLVMILVGILLLLVTTGAWSWTSFVRILANYWPALLIFWGAVKLIEHYLARRNNEVPAGIGAGGVLLVATIVFLGAMASGLFRANLPAEIVIDGEPITLFGKAYDYTQELEQPFATGNRVEVFGDRGGITTHAWDENRVKVVARKRVVAESEVGARALDEQSRVDLSTADNVISVRASKTHPGAVVVFLSRTSIRTDLEVYVPRTADVRVTTSRGDVRIANQRGNVHARTSRGDVFLNEIGGNAVVHMDHGDLTAERVQGNLELEGELRGVDVSDIGGKLTLSGRFYDTTHVSRVAKNVRFKSSVTDLEIGSLPGEVLMEIGDLRVSDAVDIRYRCERSKDVRLDSVSGDVDLKGERGDIELRAGRRPLGAVQIDNGEGDMQLYLPDGVSYLVEASSRHGEVHTEFSELKVDNRDREGRASGTLGRGGKRLRVTTDRGDIEIHRTNP